MARGSATWTALRAGALLPALIVAGAASAAEPDFYAGKTVTILTHTSPGGGYDLLARLTAQFMGRHLPGQPRMVVVNMPGAGGLTAFNYAARLAPRDGTYLTIVGQGLTLHEPAVGTSMQASLADMSWIGNFSKAPNVTVVWNTAPVKTIEQAKQIEVTVGSTGAGAPDSTVPLILNSVLGTKFKVVYGYQGGAQINLAMERGELHGRGTNTWSSYEATFPDAVRGGKLIALIQVGLAKDPALPDVPLFSDLVKGAPEKEAVAEFVSLNTALSRPFAAPPGVPAERLALLRDAFAKTMTDPEYLAAAQKTGLEIDPMNGVETEAAIRKILATSKDVLVRVNAAIGTAP